MKRDPSGMTNAQILGEHERCVARQGVIGQQMIDDGFGNLRPSDMRADPDVHPLAAEDLELMDRCRALHIEAEYRYGPGLVVMSHLVHAQGKSYRRIKR